MVEIEKVTLDDILYINTPLKLAICSYMLDDDFIDQNYDDFENILSNRDFGLNKLTMNEIKGIVKIYNENFDMNNSSFREMLDRIVETDLIQKENGAKLYFEPFEKYDKTANYYSFSNVYCVQHLLRYILHTSIEYGINYKDLVGRQPSTGENKVNNRRRWEVLSLLGNRPNVQSDIIEQTSLSWDNLYKILDPLSDSGLISPHTPKGDRKKNKEYNLTKKGELIYEKLIVVVENYFEYKEFNFIQFDNNLLKQALKNI